MFPGGRNGRPLSKMILPGEVLQVFVLEDEAFNGLYQVRSGGYVVMPRIGNAIADIPVVATKVDVFVAQVGYEVLQILGLLILTP